MPQPLPTRHHASFAELFTPKLVTVLREGYGLAALKQDAMAALTVAIVALPLSMAIAIASGTTPDKGLVTAIIGGFLISALGGSRFQIGGPAGAFIPLVATTIATHGFDGLLMATLMSGIILVVAGYLKFGTYIKYIPFPVTVGFTAGIAVIIFMSQVRDLFGLTLTGKEPPEVLHKIPVLLEAGSSINPYAVGLSLLTIVLILTIKKIRSSLPNLLIAVVTATVLAYVLKLPVETIASRFGALPTGLSMPALPDVSLKKIIALVPAALSFALLGGIESLLSAVVADGMSGRRHRSNCELAAQGYANIGSALFGGICATGTIARTATNVRAGAFGPVSGILHAVFLLLFLIFAGNLIGYIPLAALAGVLATVAWNMADKAEFAALLRASRGDAIVLLLSFLLTVFVDLTVGIAVGIIVGSLLFIHRMSETLEVHDLSHIANADRPDSVDPRGAYDAAAAASDDVMIYRMQGAFFFGAAANAGALLDRIGKQPKVFILDVAKVPFMDTTGAYTLDQFIAKLEKGGTAVYVVGANDNVFRSLTHQGLNENRVHYATKLETAVKLAKKRIQSAEAGLARPKKAGSTRK